MTSTLSKIGHPVAELPVEDVERAQAHFEAAFGFQREWILESKELGAVSRGDVAIFLRRRETPFESTTHWIFAEDLEATYRELRDMGANIVEPLETKPWGLRQFAVRDLDRNLFYFHHD